MVRYSFHDSGFAGTAATHRAGKIDVDPCIDQRAQYGLAWWNGNRAAAAVKTHLKAILHCRLVPSRVLEMSDIENNRSVLALSPTRRYHDVALFLPVVGGPVAGTIVIARDNFELRKSLVTLNRR
jgi:hypothetical protein